MGRNFLPEALNHPPCSPNKPGTTAFAPVSMVRGINGDNPRSHCGSLLLGYVYGTCSQYGWKRLDITLNDYVE
jgi:hypothetical protein